MGPPVRAVLELHAAAGHPDAEARPTDPTDLVPPDALAARLDELRRAGGAQAVRAVARDYVALWARTFPTLVRHLRGKPERALGIFVAEVYPFLRGDRLAARLESQGHRAARVRLAGGLDGDYVEALVGSFVALSGAAASCHALGGGLFEVRHRTPTRDLPVRWLPELAALRIGLIGSSFVAAALGLAWAAVAGPVEAAIAIAVLAGAVCAQAASNAGHELRAARHPGPLGPPRPPRWWWQAQLAAAASAALAAGAFLLWMGRPWVAAFALAGAGLGLLYRPLRDRGLGPLAVGVSHGPLITSGAVYAASGTPALALHPATLTLGLAAGAWAAASLHLDDLADRPLDQAAGKRTLAVRLPEARHLVGFAAPVVLGCSLGLGWTWALGAPLAGFALATAAALVVVAVQRRLGDPHGMAPARFATMGLHILWTWLLVALLLQEAWA